MIPQLLQHYSEQGKDNHRNKLIHQHQYQQPRQRYRQQLVRGEQQQQQQQQQKQQVRSRPQRWWREGTHCSDSSSNSKISTDTTTNTSYIQNDCSHEHLHKHQHEHEHSHRHTILATAVSSSPSISMTSSSVMIATSPSTKSTILTNRNSNSNGTNQSNISSSSSSSSVSTNTTLTRDQADTLASLLAGFGSGTLSSVACAPLDLIRTRMQVMGDLAQKNNPTKKTSNSTLKTTTTTTTTTTKSNAGIVRGLQEVVEAEGIKGCFRGLGPTLMTVPTFWGLYFPLYEVMKKDLYRRGIGRSSTSRDDTNNNHNDGRWNDHNEGDVVSITREERVPPVVHMSAAILSGAVADFFCNPMFIVRTRMQTEVLHYMEMPLEERKPHGISKTVKGLYKEGGLPIFWRGFTASLLGLSHVAIQFPTYEFFKAEARERSETNEESALDLLLASGFSKMVATSLTYPHEVVRSRMMDHRGRADDQQSLRQTFLRIVRNEGFGALYTGIHVSLVRVVPNCCITFMTYEMILRWTKSKL